MLDDRERRVLAELERALAETDPGLSRLSARPLPVLGPPWWPLTCAVLGLSVAVFLVTLGLVGNALLLLAVAAAPIAWRMFRRLRRPGSAGPG
jgi:hypothetical protein